MEKGNSEIEKLTDRIAKDPKSKLFVPLAEEYKKAGNIDMAIQVLRDGLRNNPGYVTARAFLGRLLLDIGDLAGAQKDLEEVIKAIPDNLLAQRKLGDLYVLLGRGGDAVQRYKAALSLNPGDKEITSLVADLEAGKDVSSRIPKPKTQAAAPAAKPQPAAAAPAAPKAVPSRTAPPQAAAPSGPAAAAKAPSAPAPAPPQPQTPQPKAPPQQKAGPSPATTRSAAPSRDEVEVVEDIIELEPIERPAAPAEAAGNTPPRSAVPAPAPSEAAFDLNEPVAERTTGAEEPKAGAWTPEEPVASPGSRPGASEEGADDLNTNTLAELYISQGFYDKAIEVYQGMLAERPDNKALLQKLEHLRALAGSQDMSGARYTPAPGGPGEYIPPAAGLFPETASAESSVPPAPPEMKSVEPAPRKETKEPAADTSASRGPQTATLRRKETIDRLESWLKNIMKEKQE